MVDIYDSSLASLPGDLNLLDFPPLGVASDDGDKVAPMVAPTKEGVAVGSGVVVDVAEVAAAAPGLGKVECNFINQSLGFSPSADICGCKIVQPPSVVLSDGAKQWSNDLIGNFLGKSPPLVVFQKTADKLWGKEGSVVICFLAPSVYMINFPSQRVRDWVLEAGPSHIQQKAIVLRKWKPGLLLDEVKLDLAPVWIKLWHVSLELYSQFVFEVGAKDEIPDSIPVDLGNENLVSIAVEPVWSPPRCKHCAIFGHSEDKCLKGVSAIGGVILKENESIGHVVQDEPGRAAREFVVQDCGAQGASSSKAIVNGEPGHVTQDCVVQDCSEQEVSGSDVESANKFAALGDGSGNVGFDVVLVDDSRKCRAAAGGVAELMQQLKPKEKVPKKRSKGKGGGKKGGDSPSAQ
ncbi:hypothetical protein V6N13_088557 [Hibiscus sabdariffa]